MESVDFELADTSVCNIEDGIEYLLSERTKLDHEPQGSLRLNTAPYARAIGSRCA